MDHQKVFKDFSITINFLLESVSEKGSIDRDVVAKLHAYQSSRETEAKQTKSPGSEHQGPQL